MKQFLCLFFLFVLFLTSYNTQAQVILDDFNHGLSINIPVSTTPPYEATNTNTTGNILGGERDVYLSASSSGAVLSFGSPTADYKSVASTQTGVTLLEFTHTYDGIDGNAKVNAFSLGGSPSVGVNMMGGGTFATKISFDAHLSNTDWLKITFKVYSDATHFSESSETYQANATAYALNGIGLVDAIVSIPRTDFTIGSGAAGVADFSSVKAVQIIITVNGPAYDMYFADQITVPSDDIPEPVLSDVNCNPGANLNVSTDDHIQFNILPNAPVEYYVAPYTYTVTATQNGNAISVTQQDGSAATDIPYTHAIPASFRLADGTAGNGDVLISVTPDWGNYPASTVILTDPGSCTSLSCNGGSEKTVTYTYEKNLSTTDAVDWQTYIPKFNQSTGKTLTKATVNMENMMLGSVFAENTSTGTVNMKIISYMDYFFDLNGTNIVSDSNTTYITSGYPSFISVEPANVFSSHVGTYLGDDFNGTVYRCLNFSPYTDQLDLIEKSTLCNLNPKLNPSYLTNATGIPSADDDMFIGYRAKTKSNDTTFTVATDLANFIGLGNIPLLYNTFGYFSSYVGGGSNLAGQATKTRLKVTVTYTYTEPCFSLSGHVFDDGNGNTNDLVNHTTGVNTGLGNPSGVQLYANLLDDKGRVVATTAIDPTTGFYNFTGISGYANYTVQISKNQGTVGAPAPVTALPTDWFNTGEQWGTAPSTNLDPTTDGKYTVAVTNANITEVNFGINKIPNADMKNYLFTSTPPAGTIIPLNGTNSTYGATPGLLSGTDYEDGSKGGTTSKFVITSLPTDGTLLYWNGTSYIPITASDVTNGTVFTNPANLNFQFTGSGYSTTTFSYAFVDQAGMTGTSNTYSISFPSVLPLDLIQFTAINSDCQTQIHWITANEVNVSHFDIESSVDGIHFNSIGKVFSGNANYNFKCQQPYNLMYYRLRIVDQDATFKFSKVISVFTECLQKENVLIYPNPAISTIYFEGADQNSIVNILDGSGKIMLSTKANGIKSQAIDVSNLINGTYYLEIENNKRKNTLQFIINR